MDRRIEATEDGGIVVELPREERDLLRSLPDQLRPVVTGEEDVAGARSRLFPRPYGDPELDAEYVEMTGASLEEERVAALDAFAETLDGGQWRRRSWHAVLDEDAALAWLSATNDARLVLAQAVGIRHESDWEAEPTDPATAALHYLGWVQEALLAALSAETRREG